MDEELVRRVAVLICEHTGDEYTEDPPEAFAATRRCAIKVIEAVLASSASKAQAGYSIVHPLAPQGCSGGPLAGLQPYLNPFGNRR